MKFLKSSLAAIFVLITACGGGGGSGVPGEVATTPVLSTLTPVSPITPDFQVIGSIEHSNIAQLSFALARLDRSGIEFVVVAGLLYSHSPPSNFAAPVRIFRVNNDGSGEDATLQILGENPSVATAKPLIADFNKDGIDDIFLAGMLDHSGTAESVVWISRQGLTHRKLQLSQKVWTHDAIAVDIDHDSDLDVVNSHGQMWLNDGVGNFQFRDHSWNLNFGAGHWMHGSGVCAGDFNRTGRTQLVITDLMQDGFKSPKADTVIYELDTALQPIREHVLPVPTLDRNTTREISHDVTCLVADVNNDTWPDILVFGRPWPENGTGWTNQGAVQILLNRGAWKFEDVTAEWMPSYDVNQAIPYMPMALDLNNDGRLDFWFTSFSNHIGPQTSVWINRNNSLTSALSDVTTNPMAAGGMIPLHTNNGWRMIYAKMAPNIMTFYTSKSLYKIN